MSFLFGSEYIVSYAISNMITLTTVCGAVFTWYTTANTWQRGVSFHPHRIQDNFVPTYTWKLITDLFTAYVLNFQLADLHGTRSDPHKLRNKRKEFMVPRCWQFRVKGSGEADIWRVFWDSREICSMPWLGRKLAVFRVLWVFSIPSLKSLPHRKELGWNKKTWTDPAAMILALNHQKVFRLFKDHDYCEVS